MGKAPPSGLIHARFGLIYFGAVSRFKANRWQAKPLDRFAYETKPFQAGFQSVLIRSNHVS